MLKKGNAHGQLSTIALVAVTFYPAVDEGLPRQTIKVSDAWQRAQTTDGITQHLKSEVTRSKSEAERMPKLLRYNQG